MPTETYDIPGFEVLATGANCEANFSDTIITRSVTFPAWL